MPFLTTIFMKAYMAAVVTYAVRVTNILCDWAIDNNNRRK